MTGEKELMEREDSRKVKKSECQRRVAVLVALGSSLHEMMRGALSRQPSFEGYFGYHSDTGKLQSKKTE